MLHIHHQSGQFSGFFGAQDCLSLAAKGLLNAGCAVQALAAAAAAGGAVLHGDGDGAGGELPGLGSQELGSQGFGAHRIAVAADLSGQGNDGGGPALGSTRAAAIQNGALNSASMTEV